jgi:two-component sensor histidine kinase
MTPQSRPLIDDATFAILDALLDEGFCLIEMVTDALGQPVDYRFLRVNRHFEAATGLRDVVGRTMREIEPRLEQSWVEAYARVGLHGETLRFAQGSAPLGRVFDVHAVPVAPLGRVAILFRDITALRHLEEEREAALEGAHHLLAELNHRVMNSFAAISAIASMEARAAPEPARPAIKRLQGRVQALGALYRRLDGATRVDRIEVAEYLGGNVEAFAASVAAEAEVAITCALAPLTLPVKAAVPLGLLLNELLTEAVGRAARSGQPGRIHVALVHGEGRARLSVVDDLPPGAGAPREAGPSLVATFAGELGAEVEVDAGAGTQVAVAFPLPA